MESLPRDFLIEIARKYELSEKQEEAFVELFSSDKKTQQEQVAEIIHISPGAFRTRMSGVYNKFSLRGSGPNKARKLHDFLLKKYRRSKNNNNSSDRAEKNYINIDRLVKEIRKKISPYIKEECGRMKVLSMSDRIELKDIYTKVNILDKITGRRRINIAEISNNFDPESEEFDRCGLGKRINDKPIPGLKAVKEYSKLMVLGKPGAGKTTFLKHLAIECCSGNFMLDRVPIFITLKEFAENKDKPDLKSYIASIFAKFGVTESEIREVLIRGKALILLDGLDEVTEEDNKRVLQEITSLSSEYIQTGDRSYLLGETTAKILPEFKDDESLYLATNEIETLRAEIEPKIDDSNTNSFVITCRIAANEYNFEKFTEVEVADFDDSQIETFVTNWFKCSKSNLKNGVDRFIKKLQETPQIKELATNPLLLTLLCLEFEDSGDFPTNRSELYDRGIDTLLRKWDRQRAIERDEIYKNLSTKRKEILLSKIAAITFENKNYFFKKRLVASYIADYIKNLPDARLDRDALEIDSDAVLKSIEAQHGLLVERATDIYSFSHLIFQEYFTAKNFIASCNPFSLEDNNLQFLASKILDKRWREVLILAVEILPDASCLLQLMKRKIDLFVADDDKIQQVLKWIKQRHSSSLNIDYPQIYTFELLDVNVIQMDRFAKIYFNEIYSLNSHQYYHFECDKIIIVALNLIRELISLHEKHQGLAFILLLAINQAINSIEACNFKESLIEFESQLPLPNMERESFTRLWENNGESWYQQLKKIAIKYRNIGHDWKLNNEQEERVRQYCYANKLLWEWIETTKSDRCYLTLEVREELKTTLLWPIEDILKYERSN